MVICQIWLVCWFQEDSDGNMDSSEEAGGLTCHQCQNNSHDRIIWCLKCDRRGYCDSCISQWWGDQCRSNILYLTTVKDQHVHFFNLKYLSYSDIPLEDLRKACPACRGACNCKVCMRTDILIKVHFPNYAWPWVAKPLETSRTFTWEVPIDIYLLISCRWKYGRYLYLISYGISTPCCPPCNLSLSRSIMSNALK